MYQKRENRYRSDCMVEGCRLTIWGALSMQRRELIWVDLSIFVVIRHMEHIVSLGDINYLCKFSVRNNSIVVCVEEPECLRSCPPVLWWFLGTCLCASFALPFLAR